MYIIEGETKAKKKPVINIEINLFYIFYKGRNVFLIYSIKLDLKIYIL